MGPGKKLQQIEKESSRLISLVHCSSSSSANLHHRLLIALEPRVLEALKDLAQDPKMFVKSYKGPGKKLQQIEKESSRLISLVHCSSSSSANLHHRLLIALEPRVLEALKDLAQDPKMFVKSYKVFQKRKRC
ncbi:hypothetical protein GUJ93_ZPchr0008g13186 [Zizania palustris]|uniref:Uncharacterized protein n=1 Tax=Zizania palustris TaxID=103762 RepID=A0A8J5RUP4_ZIZPA|nr:hypothetical protein GUJ93_ZPchr0008g13186 [Zizania palustris]